MSDKFSIIPIERLFSMILEDLKLTRIFGIPKELFFSPSENDPFRMTRYGQLLETPIGVAAGPHTQMAQNIIAAWLCGARYIELKTVQTLDEIHVSKPCIDIQDEGYNCEWSQELRIHQAYDQYLNAWIIIHILKDMFGCKSKEPGMIFNMSVGYDMKGILNENVQWFFEKIKNCSEEKIRKIAALSSLYPRIRSLDIPDRMSDNITLSTMHGCPPDEIEKIGLYLIEKKKLHTAIKLNPTLLGKDELRDILNNRLGFVTHVPDEAFGHDLKYPDALNLIKSLQEAAKNNNVHFGLKITNTLESVNHKNIFPPNEKMMYMSGRALHPISINLAKKLQNEFGGTLDISFSAGADCFNIEDVLTANLRPVTVCSDILKPGGYARLQQYLENLKNFTGFDKKDSFEKLNIYADSVLQNNLYKRNPFHDPTIKTNRELGYFDCIKAPCIDTCPTNQDIPEYLFYTSRGEYQKAYEVILRTNPFPSVSGMVCDHLCQTRCTRINYDNALLIREVKRFITEQNPDDSIFKPAKKNGLKTAVIGAGPSGLSCAYFLTLAGFEVNVYEIKNIAGGMASDAIPAFRLTGEAIKKDIERIQKSGVTIHYNYSIDKTAFEKLQKENSYIYLAVGAQKAKALGLENENADGVADSLRFLSDVRQGKTTGLGKNILVIGGGNTAMDVARTAFRLVGATGNVTIVYRRTRFEMPANAEEVKALFDEGIPVIELTAPEKIILKQGKVSALLCSKMKLEGTDKSGRPKPVKIPGSEFEIPCDTIIPVLGQDVVLDFIDSKHIEADSTNFETKIKNVFIGGDALRGGATVIKAVGDGRKAAASIIRRSELEYNFKPAITDKGLTYSDYIVKRAKRIHGEAIDETEINKRQNFNLVVKALTKEQAQKEASRCLYCDDICNVCVTVCPNRANYYYTVKPISYRLNKIINTGNDELKLAFDKTFIISQKYQVLNIADFCNECGNCSTFCPTKGRPFADKPKFYLTSQGFKEADTGFYFNRLNGKTVLIHKKDEDFTTLTLQDEKFIFESNRVKATINPADFSVIRIDSFDKKEKEISLAFAAEMSILMDAVKELY
ncbi:MAG: putative selenate reductase subunit YgfK [Bacteroidia bacterium]|nr:putative selenate reductase subunit YgfK [Bacteroidia bacterium]